VFAAVLIVMMGPASATEYLLNGSFESADFSGWELTDPSGADGVVPTDNGFLDYGAESGDWFAVGSAPTTDPSVLAQTFSDPAGQPLKVSGWAIGDTTIPGGLGEITYFSDGVKLGSPDLSSGTWTQSIFQVMATGSDTFTIRFRGVGIARPNGPKGSVAPA